MTTQKEALHVYKAPYSWCGIHMSNMSNLTSLVNIYNQNNIAASIFHWIQLWITLKESPCLEYQ